MHWCVSVISELTVWLFSTVKTRSSLSILEVNKGIVVLLSDCCAHVGVTHIPSRWQQLTTQGQRWQLSVSNSWLVTMTTVSVPALAILIGLCRGSIFHANCPSCVPSTGNACTIGGSLDVLSEPDGFHVNAKNCNQVYEKEAFQNQPAIKLPGADSVRVKLS